MSDRHVVIDALRQTLRCGHCRMEAFLPQGPTPLDKWTGTVDQFTQAHVGCPAQGLPAPAYVRTGRDGAALKRDEQGLWWDWQPAGMQGASRSFLVRPVPRADVVASLTRFVALLEREATEPDAGKLFGYGDEVRSLVEARAALTTEGVPA